MQERNDFVPLVFREIMSHWVSEVLKELNKHTSGVSKATMDSACSGA